MGAVTFQQDHLLPRLWKWGDACVRQTDWHCAWEPERSDLVLGSAPGTACLAEGAPPASLPEGSPSGIPNEPPREKNVQRLFLLLFGLEPGLHIL